MRFRIDLSAAQQRQLIEIGLATLAREALAVPKPSSSTQLGDSDTPTPAQRRKIAAKMTKRWHVNGSAKPKHGRGSGEHSTSAIRKRRLAAARLLASFDTTKPKSGDGIGKSIGTYVRRGYLKQSGDGYIRTAKPWVVER